jgi:hypothetical protein
MTAISSTTSQISPATERVYHQSNLLGDWKGTWSDSSRPVEFKVVNIRGDKAQIEYTHDGRTERGQGDVNGATITFGNVTIGTRNGSVAAFEFSVGGAKKTATLNKQASDADQNQLVGTWNGFSTANGQSISFTVKQVDGRDAAVSWTVNGVAHQGVGSVLKNTVMFGKAQVTTNDGKSGTAVLQVGNTSYAIPVTKYVPPSTSTAVNKLA